MNLAVLGYVESTAVGEGECHRFIWEGYMHGEWRENHTVLEM